ncbi:MAG: ATP-dependent Clp protease adapter ClpS [Planctomycetes bacterium]|nr:ATP-dependent Clp protease adapter ClpS [Planctomycetota bacterium]
MRDVLEVRAAQTAESTETEVDVQTRTARPWNVIVHDDPVTLMSYVTQVFMDVFGYPQSKADRLMREVHSTGRSVVWTGERERAELYVSKLHGFHLKATLETSEA